MRKYYTRPCNFYYGNYAKEIIGKSKAYPLSGNKNIAFDQVEIFKRTKKGNTKSQIYPVSSLKSLKAKLKLTIKSDLKKIIAKRKNISKLKFDKPQIMGILNITPDSFSDGGLFFNETKAYDQANRMVKNGAALIDIGGESTRPGSKTIDEKKRVGKNKKSNC